MASNSGSTCAELLAHPLDVAVDGAVVDIDLIVVGRIHQVVAALHEAGPLGQRLQQQELGDRQLHRPAVPQAVVTRRVEGQLAALQRLGDAAPATVDGPGASPSSSPSARARRSTAFTRSISSRCENGLWM